MSDTGWFYSSGHGRRGPVSVDRLVAELSRLPNPHVATVWHEGMAGWLPVAEVPEIAAKLPPPVGDERGIGVLAVGQALSIVLAVLLALNVAIGLLRILMLLSTFVAPQPSSLSLNAFATLQAVGALLFLPTALVFITWVYRATAAVGTWPEVKPRFSPAWNTIAFWFIPIIFLFRPYQAVADVWIHSLRAARPRGPRRGSESDALVQGWWAAWLACAVLGVAVEKLPDAVAATVPHSTAFILLAWQACFVAAGTAAVVIVLTVMRAQHYAVLPPALRLSSGVRAPAAALGWILGAGSLAAGLLGFLAYLAPLSDRANATGRQPDRTTSGTALHIEHPGTDSALTTAVPSPEPSSEIDLRSLEYRWYEAGGRLSVELYNGSDRYVESVEVQVVLPSGQDGLRYKVTPVPTDVDKELARLLPRRESVGGICGTGPNIARYTSGQLAAQMFESIGTDSRLRLLGAALCSYEEVPPGLPSQTVAGMPFRWSGSGRNFDVTLQNNSNLLVQQLLVEVSSPGDRSRRYWATVDRGVGMSVLVKCGGSSYTSLKAVPPFGVGKFSGTMFNDMAPNSQMSILGAWGCL